MRTLRKRRGLSPGGSGLESLEEEKPQSKPRVDWVGGDRRTDVLQAEQRKSFQEEGGGKRGKHRGERGLGRGLRIGSHGDTGCSQWGGGV